MIYQFISDNKEYFGFRWLYAHLGINSNCYYNIILKIKNVIIINSVMSYKKGYIT